MREMVISVTQAARKFADCVNRVHYQGASFILHKNGVAVARIVPVGFCSANEMEQRAASEVREEVLQDENEAAAMLPDHEEQPRNSQPPTLPKRPVLNW